MEILILMIFQLSTKTGIEIEEGTPGASSQNAIASAIGQGNHRYSSLNLARYVTTLATSGTCYNLTLIDKITDYDGNIIRENHAEVNNQVELAAIYLLRLTIIKECSIPNSS